MWLKTIKLIESLKLKTIYIICWPGWCCYWCCGSFIFLIGKSLNVYARLLLRPSEIAQVKYSINCISPFSLELCIGVIDKIYSPLFCFFCFLSFPQFFVASLVGLHDESKPGLILSVRVIVPLVHLDHSPFS